MHRGLDVAPYHRGGGKGTEDGNEEEERREGKKRKGKGEEGKIKGKEKG